MSRTLTVACVLLVTGLAYAAGVATFTWVPEELRCPCDKTELEWRLVANAIRQDKPVKLCGEFDLLNLRGTVKPKGLLVEANLRPRPALRFGEQDKRWAMIMRTAENAVWEHARKSFGKPGMFEARESMYLLIRIGGRLAIVSGFNHMELIPSTATPQQQVAAVASLMGDDQPRASR